jgi:hypothetical protein
VWCYLSKVIQKKPKKRKEEGGERKEGRNKERR